jgi:NAD(P)-dependent dehydrogenase (short-subunit alcohol dehydrogenase family)
MEIFELNINDLDETFGNLKQFHQKFASYFCTKTRSVEQHSGNSQLIPYPQPPNTRNVQLKHWRFHKACPGVRYLLRIPLIITICKEKMMQYGLFYRFSHYLILPEIIKYKGRNAKMDTKTVFITGASSDIGQAVAISLASSGFNIAAQYYSNLAAVQVIEEEAEKWGVQSGLFCYDLVHPRQAKEVVDAVIKKFKSIDVLINTVGPFYYKDILEVTPEEWAESINMNLQITFNMTYFAMEQICASRGHIINFAFSGVENLKSWIMSTGYCAAKAGIAILTKSLAASLAPSGVRVNAICPGLIEEGTTTEQERQEMANQIPFGRPGRPKK